VRHFHRRPFAWRPPENDELHVLNGMGVTLGDSIIGMNALAWLKARHPRLHIHLYRTPHAPPFVERLYAMARHIVFRVSYLPVPAAGLPDEVVDLSDFLHWPAFDREPMVDFFFRGLGMVAEDVPAAAKANRWLAQLPLPPLPPAWRGRPYVLLCDRASTPLRTLPQAQAAGLADRVWQAYRLPVCGLHPVAHSHFHDISAHSHSLDRYLAWVRGASVLVGVDSSAIHVAAGFDVPTLAFFVSIDPALRVRDYPRCRAVDLRSPLTQGLHASDDPAVAVEVARLWREAVAQAGMPWPAPASRLPAAELTTKWRSRWD
jgi:hypothetical protein